MEVRDLGRGPAVLLLHGTPSPAADWRPLAERLAPRYRVLVPALPGYGGTPALDRPTMEDVGDALHAMLAAREVADLAAIVGFSSGAYRAFDLALRHRPGVRLIGALAPLLHLDDAGRAFRSDLAARLVREPDYLFSDEVAALMRDMMLAPAWRAAHPEDEARVLAWVNLTPPAALAGELRALAGSRDLRPELARLHAHVYARVGELDVACPPATCRELVHMVPRGRLDVVPGCGHTLLIEDHAGTCAALVAAIDAAVLG